MASFKFDPSKHGLRKTLKEYEEIALRYIWSVGDKGVGSGKTWEVTKERLGAGKTISRASIIFFMNRMVDQGVLNYTTASGKGGYHRVYSPSLDERGYKKYVLKTMVESMRKDFPEETKKVLQEYID